MGKIYNNKYNRICGKIYSGRIGSGNIYDTRTSQGLYNIAVSSGLQKQADSILKKTGGEDVKKIFSGGFISDIFDVLNAMQYGVTGLLKGKSFIEGVKTRQSFSDKDALGDNGLPGVIAGIAMDIAVDPLTYIAPATIIKKIPGATKLLKGIKGLVFGKKVKKAIDVGSKIAGKAPKTYETIEGGTKLGKYLADKLVYHFGIDPIWGKAHDRAIKNIAVGAKNLVDVNKKLSAIEKVNPKIAKAMLKIDKTGRVERVGLNKLKKILSPDEYKIAKEAVDNFNKLRLEGVKVGLIPKNLVEETWDNYIGNRYLQYELGKKKGAFGFAKLGLKKKYLKGRKKLTKETIEELGQIKNPSYLLLRGSLDLLRDIENAKLFKFTAERFATDVAQEGFKQLPKGQRLAALAGKYVPENIYKYIQEMTDPIKYTLGKKLIGDFKFMKVVMNPATNARNIISNKILNWWKLGMNPLDPRTMNAERISLKEIARKGGKWTKEATKHGYGMDTMMSNEILNLLDDPQVAKFGKGLGSKWKDFKRSLGSIFQAEENQAKLAAYIFNRKYKGMNPELAWKMAESATFNYAQVTPFVRKLRTSLFGFPFITFSLKAAPVVAETAVKHPRRISAFGKIKNAIENLSDLKETQKERENEPSWIKNGFYIKLPIKDKYGRSAYFDLTYIIPFGDLVNLGDETNLNLMSKSPAINFIREIGSNKDFYGNKIFKESDPTYKQLSDVARNLTKTFMPPMVADQIPGGYEKKTQKHRPGVIPRMLEASPENQRRTLMEEMLRNVGLKIQPINTDIQETYSEWNKRSALERLLIENGILKEFSRSYVPKQ